MKPDYPHGIRSLLREELILHSIECEKISDDIDRNCNLSMAMLPIIKDRAEYVRDISEKLKLSSDLNSFIFKPNNMSSGSKVTAQSQKLFDLLEKAGIIKDEPISETETSE